MSSSACIETRSRRSGRDSLCFFVESANTEAATGNAGRGGQKKKEMPEMNKRAKRARTSESSFGKKEAEKEEKVPLRVQYSLWALLYSYSYSTHTHTRTLYSYVLPTHNARPPTHTHATGALLVRYSHTTHTLLMHYSYSIHSYTLHSIHTVGFMRSCRGIRSTVE
jgi:hypothetical protein